MTFEGITSKLGIKFTRTKSKPVKTLCLRERFLLESTVHVTIFASVNCSCYDFSDSIEIKSMLVNQ